MEWPVAPVFASILSDEEYGGITALSLDNIFFCKSDLEVTIPAGQFFYGLIQKHL